MRPVVLALAAACIAVAPSAVADTTHTVQPGHTLEAIAHRYGVTVRAIVAANHLNEGERLKPGQMLVIPGVEHRGRNEKGLVTASARGEQVRIRVRDSRGHIPEAALHAFEKLMRQGTTTHPADPRLVALVGVVSDHFGGRPIEVISGFRAYSPVQYTAHSNHNQGRALDFRITGVPNEKLYEFCRTLRDTGCGYYPNSSFVHLDVREGKAFWIDWSGPGEPPDYAAPSASPPETAAGGDDPPKVNPSTLPPLPSADRSKNTPGGAAPADSPKSL
jgi:uncharacterized protein YcbK (DUF882 family)